MPEILTTEMHNAAVKKDNEALDDSGKPASIEGLWLAMLAAAPAAPKPSAFQSAGGALPDGMSARQGAVLALVRQGKSNKCIARELEIAESTVKCHVAVVMRKLGARNRTEVVVKAASQGYA
ncbi:response regulator transcription factor [Cupriavidus basilensis]|uniref:response regulator transcription factor n=1 Tax=Cupriavidus basilensis TaxID=68895 RepID=UPI0020A62B3F|nr:helix-turn-helix transcriptional regulator [Cupriavidus basilensis]